MPRHRPLPLDLENGKDLLLHECHCRRVGAHDVLKKGVGQSTVLEELGELFGGVVGTFEGPVHGLGLDVLAEVARVDISVDGLFGVDIDADGGLFEVVDVGVEGLLHDVSDEPCIGERDALEPVLEIDEEEVAVVDMLVVVVAAVAAAVAAAISV